MTDRSGNETKDLLTILGREPLETETKAVSEGIAVEPSSRHKKQTKKKKTNTLQTTTGRKRRCNGRRPLENQEERDKRNVMRRETKRVKGPETKTDHMRIPFPLLS